MTYIHIVRADIHGLFRFVLFLGGGGGYMPFSLYAYLVIFLNTKIKKRINILILIPINSIFCLNLES